MASGHVGREMLVSATSAAGADGHSLAVKQFACRAVGHYQHGKEHVSSRA
jgi:hypothetical protein